MYRSYLDFDIPVIADSRSWSKCAAEPLPGVVPVPLRRDRMVWITIAEGITAGSGDPDKHELVIAGQVAHCKSMLSFR